MNYQGALNAFDYATKISPKMPSLYVRLADTHLKLGHYPKAIDKATIVMQYNYFPTFKKKTASIKISIYHCRL